MFGLPSPSKLLVLVIIVGAVWYGFKWLGQRPGRPSGGGKGGGDGTAQPMGRIDTVACPKCGTYTDAAKGEFCGGTACVNKP